MKTYSFNNPVACLLAVINDIEARISKVRFEDGNDISGLKNDVLRLKLSVQRFLLMKDDSEKARTIGFFGAQKRGKSSLINILLGCRLMPTHADVMSSVIIRVKQDYSLNFDEYAIDVIFKNGHHEEHTQLSFERTRNLLRKYGSRKGVDFSDQIGEIVVVGNFKNSKIMANGGMLVDTPGAELAFGEVETEGKKEGEYKSEKDNEREVDSALETLANTQIVVFVERTQYMESRNSVKFYRDNLEKLTPVTVLNFMDKWLDDHDDEPRENAIEQMKEKMVGVFGVKYGDVICASSKDKVFEAKENGNIEFLEENGINKLEEIILDRLNNLSLEKVITESVKEIKSLIARLDEKSRNFNINKLFLMNFFRALEGVNTELCNSSREFAGLKKVLETVAIDFYCNRKLQLAISSEDKNQNLEAEEK